MCYARLGPSSVLVRVLITELGLPFRGFTPPFRVQGRATRFSSSKHQQQTAANTRKVVAAAWLLETGTQVAQNDRTAKAHHHKQVWCRFEPSSPFHGQFSVQKWPFLGYFQDDRPESSGRSLVCDVGVSNEGRCCFIAIGPPKDGKWVFIKTCTMPSGNTVVHLEVKMSRL